MMNLLEVLDVLKKYEKNVFKIIRDNKEYDMKELLSFQQDSEIFCEQLKGFKVSFKNNLSRRRALIVLLQEFHFKERDYPVNMDLQLYERKARARFTIGRRDKNNLDDPNDIHPKKPREFYEDNNYKMRHYKDALELLALVPNHYFINEEAIGPFLKILKDINE